MNTEDLIHKLVLDLKPVKRAYSIKAHFLFWLGTAALSLVAAIFMVGVRPELLNQVFSIRIGFQVGAIIVLAIFSAITAIFLSIPGNEPSRITSLLAASSLLGWLAYLTGTIITSPHETLHAGGGICCSRTTLLFAFPVAGVLTLMAYRAAPVNPRLVGMFVAFAGAGVGALSAFISCSNDNSIHLLVWHFLPLLVLGLIGTFLGCFFNWQQRAICRFNAK